MIISKNQRAMSNGALWHSSIVECKQRSSPAGIQFRLIQFVTRRSSEDVPNRFRCRCGFVCFYCLLGCFLFFFCSFLRPICYLHQLFDPEFRIPSFPCSQKDVFDVAFVFFDQELNFGGQNTRMLTVFSVFSHGLQVPIESMVERLVTVPVEVPIERVVETVVEVPVDRYVEKEVVKVIEKVSHCS